MLDDAAVAVERPAADLADGTQGHELVQFRVADEAVLMQRGASGDIADAIVKKGINLDRKQIQLHEPLKTLGEFTVPVKLHKEVTAHLKVVIEKEALAE